MQADRPWAIAIALEARLINKINGFKLRLTHLLFMQKYSNIKKYKGQMEKFTQWYKSYHAQDDTGYISGQKHGIIVENKYKNELRKYNIHSYFLPTYIIKTPNNF